MVIFVVRKGHVTVRYPAPTPTGFGTQYYEWIEEEPEEPEDEEYE